MMQAPTWAVLLLLVLMVLLESKKAYIDRMMRKGKSRKQAEAYWAQKESGTSASTDRGDWQEMELSPLTGEIGQLLDMADAGHPATAVALLGRRMKNRKDPQRPRPDPWIARKTGKRPRDARDMTGPPIYYQLERE